MDEPNIFQRDHTKIPAIFTAIKDGNLKEVQKLVKAEPTLVHLKGWMDNTPLHIACQEDQVEIIKFLLESGGDVNACRDGVYPSVLEWCCSAEAVDLIYDNGLKVVSPLALEFPTRRDMAGAVDAILKRSKPKLSICGVRLLVSSVEMIRVYHKHHIELKDLGGYATGGNLLHKLAWSNKIEAFDEAFRLGVEWELDGAGYTPYDRILTRKKGREDIVEHIRRNYSHLISVDPSKIEYLRPGVKKLSDHRVVNYVYSVEQQKMAVLTNENLIFVYEVTPDGRAVLEKTIQVGSTSIKSIAIYDDQLCFPAFSGYVCKISLINYDKQIIELDLDQVYNGIRFFPEVKKFIFFKPGSSVTVFTDDFEKESLIDLEGVFTYDIVDNNLNLLSLPFHDEDDAYFSLYEYTLTDNKQLNLRLIKDFFKDWTIPSTGFCFEKGTPFFYVSFVDSIEKYEYNSTGLKQLWKYKLPFESPKFLGTTLYDLDECLWVRKGSAIIKLSKANGTLLEWSTSSPRARYFCIDRRIIEKN